uniref:Uncharacterized protein n=1 Tax=viral metagenome TaxID=1070528 RepID=A0A6C0IBW9_9ZZZZ
MSSCPPDGNRGLPIIIQGTISSTQLDSIKTTSTIELKASARTTYPTFDNKFLFNEDSMTTLRVKGRSYSLMWAQIVQTVNSSYYTGRGMPTVLAEFVLWFQSSSDKSVYVAFAPILQGASLNNGGVYINAALTRDTSYRGSIGNILDKQSINYQTCVEYMDTDVRSSTVLTLPINVLIFLDGIIIDSQTKTKFIQAGTLPRFGVPVSLFSGKNIKTLSIPSLTSRSRTLDQSTGPTRPVFSSLISTGSDSFTKKFVYYPITFITTDTETAKRAASAFKCIPLDPTKHVKNVNGAMIIDLNGDEMENANSLQDEFNTQNAEKPEVSRVNNATTVAGAVIGGIIGFSLAAGLLYFGFRMITRKTAPQITS